MRLLVGMLVLLLTGLAAPVSPASALTMRRCAEGSDVRCGTLRVPLDPAGVVPGRIPLAVARLTAKRPGGRAVFAFAGGPGQGATGFVTDFALDLGAVLKRRDLVVFDQRGTGLSDAIACPEVDRVPDVANAAPAVHTCARRLGRTASLYSTSDTVADIERVRTALGYERISIYGVSYGTKVALAYAAAHPDRVERLALDSIVPPEGPDPLLRDSFAATPRVLRELCGGGACRGVTNDPVADLSALVGRMGSGGIRGVVYSRSGRPRKAALDPTGLYRLLVSGDVEPVLRGAFPAAVRSASAGDPAALLRLADKIAPPADPQPIDPREFSTGLWLATVCGELRFPWDASTPEAQRRLQAEQYAASLGSAFGPFSAGAALDFDLIHLCEHWPVELPPPPPLNLTRVRAPALLLSGRDDLRTPLEGARRVATQLRFSRVVPVTAVGHSVVGNDVSACARGSLISFLKGMSTPASCPRRWPREAIAPVIPRSVDGLGPAGGASGLPGRTFRAVDVTLDDVANEVFTFWSDEGGLRGGHFSILEGDLVLDRVVVVPGVVVSGRVDPFDWTGRLKVAGPAAAAGELRLRPSGRAAGVLGGTRVGGRLDLPSPRAPHRLAGRRRGRVATWIPTGVAARRGSP